MNKNKMLRITIKVNKKNTSNFSKLDILTENLRSVIKTKYITSNNYNHYKKYFILTNTFIQFENTVLL